MSIAVKREEQMESGSEGVNDNSSEPDLRTDDGSGSGTEHSEETTEFQNLHGAKFETESEPATDQLPAPTSPDTPADDSNLDLVDQKISKLLDEIGQGFREDDATNLEKLTIARNYGPLLLALKFLVPHGDFMEKLEERYPRVKYSKLNRWMFIAKHESEVQEALAKYPDVAWGPMKMIDFLKGSWTPEDDAEDDEEEFSGIVLQEDIEDEPLFSSQDDMDYVAEPDADSPWALGALNPTLAAKIEAHDVNDDDDDLEAPEAPNQRPNPPPARPGRDEARFRPTLNRAEFEVEVRITFKLSVQEEINADTVVEALGESDDWTIGVNTPFEYQLSEKVIRVSHVRPWDTAPGADAAAE